MGITKKESSAFQKLADIDEDVFEERIQAVLEADNNKPTSAKIIDPKIRGTQGTGENEWYTPQKDIQANGVHEPIVLFDGQILDGRNRFRAAQETGVQPNFIEYEGDDPAGYVISLNLHRRHLSESQRAMVADKVANLPKGRPGNNASIEAVSQIDAAAKLNVSRSAVQRAHTVNESGAPELIDQVERGSRTYPVGSDLADFWPLLIFPPLGVIPRNPRFCGSTTLQSESSEASGSGQRSQTKSFFAQLIEIRRRLTGAPVFSGHLLRPRFTSGSHCGAFSLSWSIAFAHFAPLEWWVPGRRNRSWWSEYSGKFNPHQPEGRAPQCMSLSAGFLHSTKSRKMCMECA